MLALTTATGLQWCVNVQHTTHLGVEQPGVFVSVRRRAVVQLRAQNVAAERSSVELPDRSVAVGHHYWRRSRDAKAAGNQMVVGEADRRDRQLRHQAVADVDVVIPSQDQVENIAAGVGCRAHVLSKPILGEHVSSAAVQLSSVRSWDVEVADNCSPAV